VFTDCKIYVLAVSTGQSPIRAVEPMEEEEEEVDNYAVFNRPEMRPVLL
jgi:hypothetical protein